MVDQARLSVGSPWATMAKRRPRTSLGDHFSEIVGVGLWSFPVRKASKHKERSEECSEDMS